MIFWFRDCQSLPFYHRDFFFCVQLKPFYPPAELVVVQNNTAHGENLLSVGIF